jgi:SAM-dependent methyltransferase
MTKSQTPHDDYSRFKGWTSAGFGHCKRHWAAYYQLEVDACVRASGCLSDRPLRLLEIGFGNGAFMGWARGKGHSVHGLEIEAPQLEAARQAGFVVADSLHALLAQCNSVGFDGVVAFDVFEHLSYLQLKQLLQDLHSVLKPGGWILSRFPNGDSPFGRLNQHGDLTHVTTLGSMSVRQLASGTGLRLLSVGSQRVPLRHIGVPRAVVHLLCLALRGLLEVPVQLLLNAYYPGEMRWFLLAPNLVARLARPNPEAAPPDTL